MPVMAIRVRVVNDKGHIVCVFRKTSHFDKQLRPERTEAWGAEAKPLSEKWLARRDSLAQEARLAKPPVRTVDGQRYLNLPGLTLKWWKVESVLDQIAAALNFVDASGVVLKDDMAAATLTIDPRSPNPARNPATPPTRPMLWPTVASPTAR
jgi:hypothetical protein